MGFGGGRWPCAGIGGGRYLLDGSGAIESRFAVVEFQQRSQAREMRRAMESLLMCGCLLAGVVMQGQRSSLDQEASLAEANLKPQLRKQIEHVIFDGGAVNPEDEIDSNVQRMQIGPGNRRGLRVEGRGNTFCGATGNCSYWIFDPDSGAALLTDAGGYDFTFLPAVHHGLYDIGLSWNLSCCDGEKYLYRFDGHRYQLVKTTTYGSPP
jgi:hypothetical protein